MELLFNVIGHPGAGKTEACRYLARQWGFETYTPSGLIRDYAKLNGLNLRGREAFAKCHQQMAKEDPLIFMRPILGSEALRLCADGLRSPLDAQRLKQYGGYVIALTANQEVRYDRVVRDVSRNGARQPINFDDFCATETTDGHSDPRFTNTQAVIDMADFSINTEELSTAGVARRLDIIVSNLLEGSKDRMPAYYS